MRTSSWNTKTKIAVVGLSAVALTGVVGVGLSYADDPTSSPAPTATTSAQPKQQGAHKKRPLLKRALHGEVTVGGKKTRVIDFQRGTVAKISATSITVTSKDDFTKTYVVSKDTRVRQAGKPGSIADLKGGDKVRVVALKDGGTSTAKVIGEPKP